MQTLNDIADTLGVSPSTLRNKVQRYQDSTGVNFYALGEKDPLDNRRTVYPDSAVDNLLVFIDPNYQPPQPGPEAVHALVTVETGNHSTALDTPQLQGTFSLEQFRDSESISYDDPDALVALVTSGLDEIEAGMKADIKAREEKLQRSREAAATVAKRAQKFAIAAESYRLEAKLLDKNQTLTTEQLQDALGEIQSLGKPSAG